MKPGLPFRQIHLDFHTSRNKLLQAMLLDPTVSSYDQSVALINEMCERQKEILPEMRW